MTSYFARIALFSSESPSSARGRMPKFKPRHYPLVECVPGDHAPEAVRVLAGVQHVHPHPPHRRASQNLQPVWMPEPIILPRRTPPAAGREASRHAHLGLPPFQQPQERVPLRGFRQRKERRLHVGQPPPRSREVSPSLQNG